LGHFGRKKYNRNKGEQGAKQIAVIGNKHQIIIEHNFIERDVVLCKGGEFILNVEYNKN
jgi:hypothetical protein